jgi:hypothetical protein
MRSRSAWPRQNAGVIIASSDPAIETNVRNTRANHVRARKDVE